MQQSILIYSSKITPRFQYVFKILLKTLHTYEIIFTDDEKTFQTAQIPKISYLNGFKPTLNVGLQLKAPSNILFETGTKLESLNTIFFNPASEDFDFVAAAFCVLTRYEEYVCDPSQRDIHQRFTSALSVQTKNNWLSVPIVQVWSNKLVALLGEKFSEIKLYKHPYKFIPTYDVDMAWRYKNKSLFINLGGFFRDLFSMKFNQVWFRASILLNLKPDPDFTFDFLEHLHQKYDLEPIYFWLLGNYGTFDKNISPKNKNQQALMRQITESACCGIHPSYKSFNNVQQLEAEIRRFDEIMNGDADKSRQHFLLLKFPDTYKTLIEHRIEHDYTMGYADNVGFRSGMAVPYNWFNLAKNVETPLVIHSLIAMEVTLNKYLNLDVDAALEKFKLMCDTVKEFGGDFIILWHNDAFSDLPPYKNWKRMYERLVAYATNNEGIKE